MLGPGHLPYDRLADHISGRQFGSFVIFGHEPFTVAIDQMCTFTSNCLSNQRTRSTCNVKNGRMKLDELHVAQFNAGAIGKSQTIAGGNTGVGGFAENLSGAAGTQNCLLGPPMIG